MGVHNQMYNSLKLSAISGIDTQRKMKDERRVRASSQAINNPFILRGLCTKKKYINISTALSNPFDMVEISNTSKIAPLAVRVFDKSALTVRPRGQQHAASVCGGSGDIL